MSSIYQQEPPTSGKVILRTSMGDIDIELWTTEAPKACRNFIQLCLEGYYDNTIFHRLIQKFMIQGGDPTGTGTGGESVYGEPFKDEFHQRLKFTHRGLVAMANESKPNTNTSQFFLTFNECSWLDKKHTIFGKVTGDSIYNLMQLQELETDAKDRPLNSPKILKTNVVMNPFDDIVVRSDIIVKHARTTQNNVKQEKVEKSCSESSDEDEIQEEEFFRKENEKKKQEILAAKKKKEDENNKKLKNKNLLSFMEEEEEGEEYDGYVNGSNMERSGQYQSKLSEQGGVQRQEEEEEEKKKMQNIHDIGDNVLFSTETAVDLEEIEQKKQKLIEAAQKKKRLQDKIKGQDKSDEPQEILCKKRLIGQEDLTTRAQLAVDNKVLVNYQTRRNKKTNKMEIFWDKKQDQSCSDQEESSPSSSSSDSEEFMNDEEKTIRQKQKSEYENLKISFLQQKRDGLGTHSLEMQKYKDENTKLLTSLEKRKQKFLNNDKTKKHEGSYLERLEQFRQQITKVDNQHSWIKHNLKYQVTGDRAFQDFEARERVKEYNIDEDVKKKGFVNKAVENLKRGIDQLQELNNQPAQKVSLEELLKLTEN